MLIKGGGGLEEEEEEELGTDSLKERGEGKHQEKETGEGEKEEDDIRLKREAGVFFGLTPSSNVLWDAPMEKKVDGGNARGHHKNGFQQKEASPHPCYEIQSSFIE